MQNIFKNPKKITRGTRHDNKDKRSGFVILSFFKQRLSILQSCRPQNQKCIKTLSNSLGTFTQAAP
jgi:hypothetical protein